MTAAGRGEVRRDRWGVPHLVADSVADLAFLQGRVTALDRTWQLERSRLEAEGRTASVLGERGLAWDVLARRARLVPLARRAYAGLVAEAAAFLDAFVAGVDAGLDEAAAEGRVPELAELGADAGRWSPWTPLAVFAARHLLFATFPGKLRRRHVRAVLGERAAALMTVEGLSDAGSNAWVVGGARTASGLPMVGGDPHRTFESPNVYQQVRLTCTGAGERDGRPFDVAGLTFPGVPGVQHFGHAGAVAWGITNAMADYQDLYLERLVRDGGRVRARGPRGTEPVERTVERVEVRGGAAVEVEALVTARGPVVLGGPGEAETFSLRWPAWVLGDLGFGCLLPLLRSRTAADVEAALAGWVEPVNNLLVADAQGEVRQRVVGRVPARAELNRWRPVPAWEAAHAWQGWVEPMPGRRVPEDGHLVSANHRQEESFGEIGVEFAPPGRARRIEALLEGRSGLVPEDFAAIHRDVLAGQPAVLVDALRRLDGRGNLPPAAAQVLATVVGWDQHWHADSVAASTYAAVRDAFVARTAAAPPFDALAGGSPYGSLLDPWFHVPTLVYLNLATVLSDAGRAALPDLEGHLRAALADVARAGPPPPWGDRHRYRPLHALGSGLEHPPPLAGDNDCVRCTGAVPGSDTAFRGSVARYAWDLAGLDRSGWVVPLGSSADPRSPHHHDQLEPWVEGRLLPVEGSGE